MAVLGFESRLQRLPTLKWGWESRHSRRRADGVKRTEAPVTMEDVARNDARRSIVVLCALT